MFKWCQDDFLISLLVSDFQRSVWECSVYSWSCPWISLHSFIGMLLYWLVVLSCKGNSVVMMFDSFIVELFPILLPMVWLASTLAVVCSLGINISSVVEFQRWWVLKSKLFAKESTYSKEILIPTTLNHLWFSVVCKNQSF